ncbi:MAG: hypothetical protein HRT66_01610 [Flavobacteriaceae bacterium]|nr:hypothetical protein [Flavobacteriaceae bacterium]
MKKIVALAVFSIFYLNSCKTTTDIYSLDEVNVIGLFEDENKFYLVFSVKQESVFYCSRAMNKKNDFDNQVSIYFVRSRIGKSSKENKVDYKSYLVKNNPTLIKHFDLNPYFNYIKFDTPFKEIHISDEESTKKESIEIKEVKELIKE